MVYMKSWDRDKNHKAREDPGWFGLAPRPCSGMGQLKAELCVLGRIKKARKLPTVAL